VSDKRNLKVFGLVLRLQLFSFVVEVVDLLVLTINCQWVNSIISKETQVLDKKCPNSRLAKSEKGESIMVNDYFKYKHKV
jgi:hypothetical protein